MRFGISQDFRLFHTMEFTIHIYYTEGLNIKKYFVFQRSYSIALVKNIKVDYKYEAVTLIN